MKAVIKKLPILLMVILLSTSCLTTKTYVGQFREKEGKEYVYAKSKQFWLFWGLVPLGRTSVNSPSDGDCKVVTRFNLVDAIVSGLTGGLVTSYTIKIKAKRRESADD